MTVPNPVVIVPVHSAAPNELETFALRRCGEVLGSHPIRLVHPRGLNLSAYTLLLPQATAQPVPAHWMSSVRAYNRMLMSPEFFQLFTGYSHVLIHEPDALVIADELLYWCQQEYDFIGAPWFKGYRAASPEAPFLAVGNSGFSLFCLQSVFLALGNTRWMFRKEVAKQLIHKLAGKGSPYGYGKLAKAFGAGGTLKGAAGVFLHNCDVFWSYTVPSLVTFNVAPIEAAAAFSWEVNPRTCYEVIGRRLPFGLHKWWKYDRPFLEQALSEVGIVLPDAEATSSSCRS